MADSKKFEDLTDAEKIIALSFFSTFCGTNVGFEEACKIFLC